MSAFNVVPKNVTRYLAVRVWPGNEEDVESIFGDYVAFVDDPKETLYDYLLLSEDGDSTTPIARGDWLVLHPDNTVEHLSTTKFSEKFTILESVFNLPDPTGKQDQS